MFTFSRSFAHFSMCFASLSRSLQAYNFNPFKNRKFIKTSLTQKKCKKKLFCMKLNIKSANQAAQVDFFSIVLLLIGKIYTNYDEVEIWGKSMDFHWWKFFRESKPCQVDFEKVLEAWLENHRNSWFKHLFRNKISSFILLSHQEFPSIPV